MMSGRATLLDCTLRRNVAKIFQATGWHSSGGAAAIGISGSLELIGVRLLSNDAGGTGAFEFNRAYRAQAIAHGIARAAHIDCAGQVTLVDSSILSPPPSSSAELGVGQLEFAASALITGRETGAIMLRDCIFESAIVDAVLLRLIGSQSQAVMRGCTATNMIVDVRESAHPISRSAAVNPTFQFAAVNSTFKPPLSPLPSAIQPPDCSAIVAGETVCDPRAECKSRVSGGVECSCVGEELQYMPGVFPDGKQCQQATRVNLFVQSKTVILKAQKPGNYSKNLAMTVRADGEKTVAIQHSLRITHLSRSDENLTEVGNASWPLLNDTLLALHGFALLWDEPPSDDSEVYLNGDARQFTASKSYAYHLRLDCGKQEPCIADGDRVETVMQIGAPSDSSSMRSEVRLITEVEALLSCDRSQAWVEHDVRDLPPRTPFRVRLAAVDVDDLPVKFTRAEINLVLGGRNVPVQWSRGSNEYVTEVPAELTAQPGLYDLVMHASNAWGEAGQITSCVLLRRAITVKEGLSNTWILVGAGATAVAIVGGLVLLVRKRHADLQAIMVMLLTEMGMLVFAICTALANLVTDGIVFGRLLRGELPVSTAMYTVAYATILCFGVVVTALSLGYRIHNAGLMKAQLQLLAPQGQTVAASSTSAARRQVQQHEWELVQTHRTKVTLSLSLMTAAAQGVRTWHAS